MVSRVFRSILRDPSTAAEVGLDRETAFDYHSSARQLERVADHASKIAENAMHLDAPPEDVGDLVGDLHESAVAVIEKAMDALLAEDSDEATRLANEARQAVDTVDERAREADTALLDLDSQQAQLLGLVVDSLSRAGDYGGNVAETALQKAAPKP
jgi:phosphate uptake regulator